MDGTHIKAHVPASRQTSFRGRKQIITQNVMCCCDFDMKFTFVYAGWEGTANDSRVFMNAVGNEENNFPWAPEGTYMQSLHKNFDSFNHILMRSNTVVSYSQYYRSILFDGFRLFAGQRFYKPISWRTISLGRVPSNRHPSRL